MSHSAGTAYVIDDDGDLAGSVARLMTRHGWTATPFSDPQLALQHHARHPADCIVTDVMMGDDHGFVFADQFRALDPAAAIVFMTAWPHTSDAVDAVRLHGGVDYLEKPVDEERLMQAAQEGAAWSRKRRLRAARVAALSPRERDVFELLVQGHSNKVVAGMLQLSPKTVEDHRAAVLRKTGAKSLAQLIQIAHD